MKPFLCIAHRGASGHEPENTLLAIERALAMGADWIEVDVFAVESELVVIHDDTLGRTTNGTGRVTERSLAYLRGLDAGKGQRIPLLSEVLDAVRDRAGINVELKGPGTAGPTVDCLRKRGWPCNSVLLSAVDPAMLRHVRRADARMPTGLLLPEPTDAGPSIAETLGAFSIHPSLRWVHPRLVEEAHRRGLRVYVYTVNSQEDCRRLRDMGVDGVFTDYPEIVLES
ncbi:MAG: glycerophosphodiester phosphodiesterase [Kiritimatiellae bacterium]|nr:glycerophosphodiester phosphodiesterase [Kiritimatiellia bacterium]